MANLRYNPGIRDKFDGGITAVRYETTQFGHPHPYTIIKNIDVVYVGSQCAVHRFSVVTHRQ